MVKLSASKINTYLGCSFYGYVRYNLGLPSSSNLGSDLGGIVHSILETVAMPNRENYIKISISAKDPYIVPSIKRYAEILLRKKNILSEDNLNKVRDFLLTAYNSNFLDEDCERVEIEKEFDIKTDRYWIGGFIDKIKWMKDGSLIIVDYKSSKKKFQGEELKFNLQSYMYALAVSKMYPDAPLPTIEFIFLKFPKAPYIRMQYTKQQLKGFEDYLTHVSEHISDFTVEKALSDMACDGGFDRKWRCGKANVIPFDVKDDGSPVWVCPYRFAQLYWSAEKIDHKPVTAFTKKDLDKYAKLGYTIVQKRYNGCPRFN